MMNADEHAAQATWEEHWTGQIMELKALLKEAQTVISLTASNLSISNVTDWLERTREALDRS